MNNPMIPVTKITK